MKFLRVLCVVALVAFFAVGAYAETQNVKVSGDLAVRGFFRDNYAGSQSLTSSPNENIQANGLAVTANGNREGRDRSNSSFFMSTTELQIDADLTDNVSTCIRLLNQRDWNSAKAHGYNENTQVSTIGSGGYGHSNSLGTGNGYFDDQNEFAVDLELAYVTLKNFIYSPLTVTIGRQNLWFGKGFIVGANQRVRNAINYGAAGLPQPISAPEYSAQNAFDSVKGVLDFDPWTLTGIYSKIWQNDILSDDGLDLWGVNVGYKFDAYKGEAEGYWFYKRDKQVQPYNWVTPNGSNDVNTIGLRGSFDPIDIVTVYAEFAGQLGSYAGNALQGNNRSRVAGALDVGAECRYFTDKWNWKPKLGVEYIWYSGDAENVQANGSGQYHGWDPMFRGKTDSLIREFIGRYYFSAKYPFSGTNYYNSADNSFQNQHQVIFSGTLQPMDSLKLNGNLNMFWNQESYDQRTMKDRGYVGTELDLGATWDYTEDVSFNLAAGWFVPGQVYYNDDATAATAADVVGSVKVSF
ncbi:MAG: alginate export family protein [Candidatus Omnitrophota bacterium]|nr:alginate export family protein [Candidatus Omnitrophota bacterium]